MPKVPDNSFGDIIATEFEKHVKMCRFDPETPHSLEVWVAGFTMGTFHPVVFVRCWVCMSSMELEFEDLQLTGDPTKIRVQVTTDEVTTKKRFRDYLLKIGANR